MIASPNTVYRSPSRSMRNIQNEITELQKEMMVRRVERNELEVALLESKIDELQVKLMAVKHSATDELD